MAFCALLGTKGLKDGDPPLTPASADAAAGGGPSSGGRGGYKPQAQAPPQPQAPVRMPCKTRGLHSEKSSSAASSPPGTPSTAGSPGALVGNGHRLGRLNTLIRTSNRIGTPRRKEKEKEEEAQASSCFSWWSTDDNGTEGRRKHKAQFGLDWNDFCCLRDSGDYRHFEPIPEDKPETEFDKDVAMLELHSLLRHHAIEPKDTLVKDMLQWQTRTVDRSRGTPTVGTPLVVGHGPHTVR